MRRVTRRKIEKGDSEPVRRRNLNHVHPSRLRGKRRLKKSEKKTLPKNSKGKSGGIVKVQERGNLRGLPGPRKSKEYGKRKGGRQNPEIERKD